MKPTVRADRLVLAALVVLAVLARVVGLRHQTEDMVIFEGWYHRLDAGGWHGLGKHIGNYNAPFLYVMALSLLIPGPVIIKIKLVWLVFDVVLAFFAYKIVGLAWAGRRLPVAAALIVVMLPTVVVNASFYGQMDAMWASFALGGVYFLARGRPWWGVSLCTVAFAIKPQGIFIFPLLLLLVLAGRIPWRTMLAVPVVFVGLDLPAIALGRNPVELLTIYSMGRQASHVPGLTLRAPSVYAFLPATGEPVATIRTLGYIFTAALVLGICYALIARGLPLTDQRIVTAGTLFAILVPFTMPGMHERYFFLADVLSVVLVFFRPRLWYVPLLVQASSLLAYQAYLFNGRSRVPLPLLATLMLAALLVVAHDLLRETLRAPAQAAIEAAATPPEPAARPALDDSKVGHLDTLEAKWNRGATSRQDADARAQKAHAREN